jgi:hypothetical protein
MGIQGDDQLVIIPQYRHYLAEDQCESLIGLKYCDGLWINNWSIPIGSIPNRYQLTEKTAVGVAVAIMHQSNMQYKRHLFQEEKHYTITKLMLLREIVSIYLERDLLIAMFDVTE